MSSMPPAPPPPSQDDMDRLIGEALREDFGLEATAPLSAILQASARDITSLALVPAAMTLEASLVAREALVPAGLGVALRVFALLDPGSRAEALVREGQKVAAGTELARIKGQARALLAAERSALNLLQHASGVATLTRRFVEAIAGTKAVLLDTRKTLPGLRALEKYATALGGARNHRMGLYDAVLIKDNHIALAGGVRAALQLARQARGPDAAAGPITIECDTLEQVGQALECGVERILLDNMNPDQLRAAVAMVQKSAARSALEASGGVGLETIRAIAESGVDFISVGAITLSARAVDIGLDYRS